MTRFRIFEKGADGEPFTLAVSEGTAAEAAQACLTHTPAKGRVVNFCAYTEPQYEAAKLEKKVESFDPIEVLLTTYGR